MNNNPVCVWQTARGSFGEGAKLEGDANSVIPQTPRTEVFVISGRAPNRRVGVTFALMKSLTFTAWNVCPRCRDVLIAALINPPVCVWVGSTQPLLSEYMRFPSVFISLRCPCAAQTLHLCVYMRIHNMAARKRKETASKQGRDGVAGRSKPPGSR